MLGVPRSDKASEGVNGGEASVACRRAVCAVGLQMLEKLDDALGLEIGKVEINDIAAFAGPEEP